jgi:hypothetical protein
MSCIVYNNPINPNFTIDDQEVSDCLGIDLTFNQWKNQVNRGVCLNAFDNYIHSNTGERTINLARYNRLKDGMSYMFDSYYSKGYRMVNPGQTGYDNIQDSLINICNSSFLPGICSKPQAQMCSQCNRTNVLENTPVLRFCGCYVSPDPLILERGINEECDPLCTGTQIIKKATPDGQLLSCNQAVCVINNINLTATQTTIGSINFTQVCPTCTGSASCLCIIDSSAAEIGGQLGLNNPVSFNQLCGDKSVCLSIKDGIRTEVPCAGSIEEAVRPPNFPISYGWWILAVIIIVIGIIIFLAYLWYFKPSISRVPRT